VVGPQSSGTLGLAWDGRKADGTAAQAGSYLVRGNVVVGGKAEPVVPSTYSRVETVSWDAFNADLNLNLAGGAVIPMGQVTRIGQEADPRPAESSETVNTGE
jgi:flagellar basal-body rod modification protein FlgD